jgi:hypothetical protein
MGYKCPVQNKPHSYFFYARCENDTIREQNILLSTASVSLGAHLRDPIVAMSYRRVAKQKAG